MENNRRNQPTDLSEFVFGKVQPQACDLEEAVLAACMLEKESLLNVLNVLKFGMFYKQTHQSTFQAISSLFQANRPVDILTVIAELRKMGELENVGGAFWVSGLTDKVMSGANAEYHARIIYQKYLSRELIRIGSETIKKAYNDETDILELIDETSKSIIYISDVETNPDTEPSKRYEKALNQIQLAMKSGNSITGIPSKIAELDRLTGGWQNEDLITIACRPGGGKSALAIKLGTSAAEEGIPTWMFSLEMSDTQIAMREFGMKSSLKYSHLRKGQLESGDLTRIMSEFDVLSNQPFYVDSAPHLNIQMLRSKLVKAIFEKGIKFAIIDYINLMESDSTNKYYSTTDKISDITKELKRCAKQFKIPIVLLAQLNRDVEKELDKKPKLHHLKSSGAIEEYSDMVMLLYRPAYYDKNAVDQDGLSEANSLYIDVAKHKQGGTGEIKTYCEIDKNIILDWNDRTGNSFKQINRPVNTEHFQNSNPF